MTPTSELLEHDPMGKFAARNAVRTASKVSSGMREVTAREWS